MGGSGSGNWCRSRKNTADSCISIDVRYLHREGILSSGRSHSLSWLDEDGQKEASIRVNVMLGVVKLICRYQSCGGSEWEDIEESVPLEWTDCNYGGSRQWFLCPGVVNGHHCGRRVAILYAGGRYFLCRHCYDLVYKSQRGNRMKRLVRKAQKIRQRLGGETGLHHPFPEKPKGMHWRTYERLRREEEMANDESLMALFARWAI